MIHDLKELQKQLLELKRGLRAESREEEGYIPSSVLVYTQTKEGLARSEETLRGLTDGFIETRTSYARIFPFQRMPLRSLPRYSSIFQTVPQYRILYLYMSDWFDSADYGLERERMMPSLMKGSYLYEV